MWVATTNFPTAASHPFYTRLNRRLAEHYFDDFRRRSVSTILCGNHGTAGPAARHVLPAVVDWLFRRDRFGARHRVARGGLLRLARLSGRRSGRCAPDHSAISRTRRLLVHASAFNLGLWMRTLFGIGTPRGLQGRGRAWWRAQYAWSLGCKTITPIGSQTDRPTLSVPTDEQVNCVSLKTPLAPSAARW